MSIYHLFTTSQVFKYHYFHFISLPFIVITYHHHHLELLSYYKYHLPLYFPFEILPSLIINHHVTHIKLLLPLSTFKRSFHHFLTIFQIFIKFHNCTTYYFPQLLPFSKISTNYTFHHFYHLPLFINITTFHNCYNFPPLYTYYFLYYHFPPL